MNLQHVRVKFFVDGELSVDLARVIEVFHDWVAAQSTDELLIDVADYRHVPAGPSVALVGLEADYVLDNTGDRFGLLYNRKAALDGSNDDRFLQAMTAARQACARLEAEFDGLKFSRREFELTINDRAIASPGDDEAVAGFRTALTAFLESGPGADGFDAAYSSDPRQLVGAVVTLSTPLA